MLPLFYQNLMLNCSTESTVSAINDTIRDDTVNNVSRCSLNMAFNDSQYICYDTPDTHRAIPLHWHESGTRQQEGGV